MKVLCFGSLNIDYVYSVPHFVRPGETLAANGYHIFSGGKGLNQATAVAKTGIPIYMAGAIGKDGNLLLESAAEHHVNTEFIRTQSIVSGHTIIQVDANGQNCILYFGGANLSISKKQIEETLQHFSAGDILLLQNEISELPYLIETAAAKEMTIILNPSPFDEQILALPLEKISYFLINEIEGFALSGANSINDIIPNIHKRYARANICLTLGSEGAQYFDGSTIFTQAAYKANAVDTTAAGDTFTGYFVYGLYAGLPTAQLLDLAARAAAITVSRKGAAASIPILDEVLASQGSGC
ncbi:MAG: ribokinase [Christensenellaceae bacterium]